MKIKSIEIKNFFCFINIDEPIYFGDGLNIISGKNGGGKSQLFNAFYWVFFNHIYTNISEVNKNKRMKRADDIILLPDYVKHNLENNETTTTEVTIKLEAQHFFQKDRTIIYIFKRHCNYEKKDGGIIKTSKNILDIEYSMDNQINFVPSHQNKIVLDEIFPPQIRPFVWYQGETMEDLYKFEDSAILTNAIDEISYYPIYRHLTDIASEARKKIERDINKLARRSNKISKEQRENLYEKEKLIKEIENDKEKIKNFIPKISALKDDIVEKEAQLSRYDEFVEQRIKINKLESDHVLTMDRIEQYQEDSKANIISRWLLNGCDSIIKDAEKNLEILSEEIQEFTKMKNPVPLNLPGPEYIQKMLNDEVCYICERPVADGSDEMYALKRRLEDFRDSLENKILTRNYTELNRRRTYLLRELPYYEEEMRSQNKKIEIQIDKRNRLKREIDNFYAELGIRDRSTIDKGSNTAAGLMSEIKVLKDEKTRLIKRNERLESQLEVKYSKLKRLEAVKYEVDPDDLAKTETIAKNYIEFFEAVLEKLKSNAYDTLIFDLENESNRLFRRYLGDDVPGEIIISKNGADVYNTRTDDIVHDLSMGQQAAMKLAIANSFLFISAKKMNRSYPLITDAPTSDLDPDNTYNLTVNLKDSFEQMIIMSKDYTSMIDEDIAKLIKDAQISHYYNVENVVIDANLGETRDNKESIIINKFSKN